jgi:hypothetical protein
MYSKSVTGATAIAGSFADLTESGQVTRFFGYKEGLALHTIHIGVAL